MNDKAKSDNRFFEKYITATERTDAVHREAGYRLYRSYVRDSLTGLFEDGRITEKDLDDDTAMEVMAMELHSMTRQEEETGKFYMALDHTEGLLEEAKVARSNFRDETAALLYATYFEHAVNGLLTRLMNRKGISKMSAHNIVKSKLDAKLTGILEILGVDIPTPEFRHFLLNSLSARRNGYTHYKWKEHDINDRSQEIDFKEIEKYIKYFKQYRSRCLYGNRKTVIMEKIESKIAPRTPENNDTMAT